MYLTAQISYFHQLFDNIQHLGCWLCVIRKLHPLEVSSFIYLKLRPVCSLRVLVTISS